MRRWYSLKDFTIFNLFNPHNNSKKMYYCYLHFSDKESETQRK